jgi:hypothetical protein
MWLEKDFDPMSIDLEGSPFLSGLAGSVPQPG